MSLGNTVIHSNFQRALDYTVASRWVVFALRLLLLLLQCQSYPCVYQMMLLKDPQISVDQVHRLGGGDYYIISSYRG